MKHYRRILSYIRPYTKEVALSVFFNLLLVIFSLASISVLIPVLQIIFEDTRPVSDPVAFTGLGDLKNYLIGNLNYYINTSMEEYGKRGVLIRVLAVAIGLFLLKNLSRYFGAAFLVVVKNGVEKDLRNDLHKKVLDLEMSYYSNKRKGDIMTRLTTDLTEIQWAIISSVKRLIEDPLMIILTLITLAIFSLKLTLFVLILIPITGVVITTIGNQLKKPSERAKAELGRLMSFIEEDIYGLPILKSFTAETWAHRRFSVLNKSYFNNMNKMLFRKELSSPVSEMLGFLVVVSIIWYGGILILEQDELQPAVFITYVALFYQIIGPSKSLSTAVYDIKRGEASATRVYQVLNEKNSLPEPVDPVQLEKLEKGISFSGVNFKYGDRYVLRDINLFVPKGSSLALVGESGSGKTTLANLLNRFYDVSSGSISIDDVDIKALSKKNLRQMIGFISQESLLFNDSIYNNILLGKPQASREQVIKAAKLANAHIFIKETEFGYETPVGDRGMRLSGGQRQRIAIARALIKDPPILVLDEATSALDSESERLVQEALDHVMVGRTSIIIAHRLSTIQFVDKIAVMQNGRIIEKGSHNELIKNDRLYKRYVQLQAF